MFRYSHSRKIPEKTSLLHIVRRNFSYFDRNTFLHRYIYIGEISNELIDSSMIIESFEKCIKPINDRYNDEPITGFLLYFGNHFCHVLESSEESLVRHLRLLNENDVIKPYLNQFKLIIIYHHMNQRFIDEWVPITIDKQSTEIIKDPKGIKEIEKLNLKETSLKIKSLIEKLYAIGNTLKPKVEESKTKMRASKQRLRSFPSLSSSHAKISIDVNLLPKIEDLMCLVNSDNTKPLRIYLEIYNKMPFITIDDVCPLRSREIPMDIFEEKINPVGELSINAADIL